jgi:(4S)-4-hydroxy-5-phosphonooxypentane-2,3-dione isomerase
MFIVTVELEVHPENLVSFMTEMLANAQASLEREPECHQFDVCQAVGNPQRIFLYEVYASPEAFQYHLAQAHFLAFDAASQGWVVSKRVNRFTRL